MATTILSPAEVVNLNLAELKMLFPQAQVPAPVPGPTPVSWFWTALVVGIALLLIVSLFSSILSFLF